ncbi:hypothetical protein GCM10027605_45470 [Micromonospora zhanjiangensis]
MPAGRPGAQPASGAGTTNLGDILERVLDRGIVIAGDIRVNLLDIELLTIKLRLVVASVDTAREMGIDWWEHDPFLSNRPPRQSVGTDRPRALPDERDEVTDERPAPADERRPDVRERRSGIPERRTEARARRSGTGGSARRRDREVGR